MKIVAETAILVGLVLLVIVLSFVSVTEYLQANNLNAQLNQANSFNLQLKQSIENIPTAIVTTTEQVTFYNSSSIVLHVTCCPNFPQAFVLADDYLFNVLEYAPPPPSIINGTTMVQMAGVLVIIQVTHAGQSQNVSFGWTGTFSENFLPFPSKASAFSGALNFLWFQNNSTTTTTNYNLYLRIDTNATTV